MKSGILTDKVHTRQLLQSLHSTTRGKTLAQGSAQNLDIRRLAQAEFVLVVCLDLRQLGGQGRVVDIDTTEPSERLGCRLMLALLDQKAWRLGQDEHADNEDDGPGKLDGNGDAVAAGIVAILGRVVDDGGQQETDGDGQLVAADNGASDPFGGAIQVSLC